MHPSRKTNSQLRADHSGIISTKQVVHAATSIILSKVTHSPMRGSQRFSRKSPTGRGSVWNSSDSVHIEWSSCSSQAHQLVAPTAFRAPLQHAWAYYNLHHGASILITGNLMLVWASVDLQPYIESLT